MAANLMEDKIMESIYESNKNWVSVEVVLNKSLTPSELFNLTEKQAGDRFYLRLNDNMSSFSAIMQFKDLRITLKINNLSFGNGKNLKRCRTNSC